MSKVNFFPPSVFSILSMFFLLKLTPIMHSIYFLDHLLTWLFVNILFISFPSVFLFVENFTSHQLSLPETSVITLGSTLFTHFHSWNEYLQDLSFLATMEVDTIQFHCICYKYHLFHESNHHVSLSERYRLSSSCIFLIRI